MRLDCMKEEFPQMPESIRQRIEREVARQMDETAQSFVNAKPSGAPTGASGRAQLCGVSAGACGRTQPFGAPGSIDGKEDSPRSQTVSRAKSRRHFGGRRFRTAWIAAAAVAAAGTTVFAGAQLGLHFYQEKVGNYGVEVVIEQDSENGGTIPEEVPAVIIQTSYLPDEMEVYDDGCKIKLKTAEEYDGTGISMEITVMDLEQNASDAVLTLGNAEDSRQLTVGEHEAVLVNLFGNDSEEITQRRLYILFPEYWRVLTMYASREVSKEDLLAIAEGITLEPTGETEDLSNIRTWSDEAEPETELEVEAEERKTVMTAEDMENLHEIGESFSISSYTFAEDADGTAVDDPALSICVTQVEVSDNLSLLGDWQNSEFVPDSFREQADENGVLLADEIRYIKKGDGIDTLDTVAQTETVEQRLVYLTLEYTNEGDQELHNILFFVSLTPLVSQEDGTLTFFDRVSLADADCDTVSQGSPAGSIYELQYYDVVSGDLSQTNGSNYISSLAPQETVTVHLAFIVNEDELQYLYLDPVGSTGADAYSFSENDLAVGFVDIRQ